MIKEEVITFIKVVESGSFNKASESLYITPTAIMRKINKLENEIGTKLINRDTRGISLTSIGKIYYTEAIKLKKFSENSMNLIRASINKNDVLRIGTSILSPCNDFFDLYNKTTGKDINVQIHIIPFEDNKHKLGNLIIGKDVDAIVTLIDSYEWKSNYEYYVLGTKRLCISIPKKHKLAKYSNITLDDLRNETIYISKYGISKTIDDFRNKVENSNYPINFKDIEDYYNMEIFNKCNDEKQLLVSVECWKNLHPGMVTIPLSPTIDIQYGILYSKEAKETIMNIIKASL